MLLKPNENTLSAGVDLTPVIDIVFLLLIFFLVATTFHESEREMQIALPQASASGPISAAMREIVINVDAEGGVIVGGRAMADEDLAAMIRSAVGVNPDQKVSVRGDRTTAYANIARVLDVCKGAGISEPYLDTVPIR